MLNPDNATLEWCAKWIEDSLRAETNERTIEFGKNMAMTIRAVKTNATQAGEVSGAPVVDTKGLIEWLDMLVIALEASQKFDYNEWGQFIMGAEGWADKLRSASLPAEPRDYCAGASCADCYRGDCTCSHHAAAPLAAPVGTVDERDTFAAKHFTFGPCVHSMVKRDCPSCCQSHAIRLEMQLGKLEASTALPVRKRIEKAVREQMAHCYQVYKGVPPTVEDWVGGALHYVMWGIERDLPLVAAAPADNDDSTSE